MNEEKKSSTIQVLDDPGLPDYLREIPKGELGTENIGGSDIIIPRLKICQALSKIKEDNETIRDGDFYNSATNEIYGKEILLYFLYFWRSKIWFGDQMKLRGIEMVSGTGANAHVRHIGPEIEAIVNDREEYERGIDAHNFFVVRATQLGMPEVMIFTCQSAAMKYSRQLNATLLANSRRGIPVYANKVKVGCTFQKFSKGSAYMPAFTPLGFADKAEFIELKELYEKAKALQDRDDVLLQDEPADENKEPAKNRDFPFGRGTKEVYTPPDDNDASIFS